MLPPGPRIPPPLQIARFLRRPIGFMDDCHERFGSVFTLRLLVGEKAVFITEPSYLRELWSNDRDHRLNAGRKFLLEPILGSQSVLLQVGNEHLAVE